MGWREDRQRELGVGGTAASGTRRDELLREGGEVDLQPQLIQTVVGFGGFLWYCYVAIDIWLGYR